MDDLDEQFLEACRKGALKTVRKLLDQGANVQMQNGEPLYLAAYHGHMKLVSLLVKRGADIHADDDRALIGAAERSSFKMVERLILMGASVHADNDRAVRCTRSDRVARLLVDHGASQEAYDQRLTIYKRSSRSLLPIDFSYKYFRYRNSS